MLHLKQGDTEPTININKLTLFDLKFCPFCQRVRFTLDYHNIPYDRVLINLANRPEWYYRLHPDGKVPLLLYKGERLVESDIVMRFVDQFNGDPETSLFNVCGEEGFKSALALSMNLAKPRYRVAYCDDASTADVEEFKAALTQIEKAIKGNYICGDRLSLADLALAPFFNAWEFTLERLAVLKPDDEIRPSLLASCPKVHAYRDLVLGTPFAKATAYTDKEYAAFVKIYKSKDLAATF